MLTSGTMTRVLALFCALPLAACKTNSNASAVKDVPSITSSFTEAQYDTGVNAMSQFETTMGMPAADQDVTRTACWKNPAAFDFTDLQRLVYCFYPLEFRICNSIILAKTKLPTPDSYNIRLQAYDDCAKASGLVSMLSDDTVHTTYVDLFLKNAQTLPANYSTDLVGKYKPTMTSPGDFATLFYGSGSSFIRRHGGLVTAKADLATCLTPAVPNPDLIAQAAFDAFNAVNMGKAAATDLVSMLPPELVPGSPLSAAAGTPIPTPVPQATTAPELPANPFASPGGA